ncbi:hypothetical protein N866_04010 [Actinotalea ferrariae CF5-4]|uniref:Uncharacterized protein n=1 Tax=Actinotalea ferrariae CF5-4 TaxID=948458 RepID=A0A021VP60_9CELL|nr:hypothetical protein [Actinotalea ferrariae]EYR62979.1 hypothetical protein N866_04010 [Actinotalea ferrariae CF5-4]
MSRSALPRAARTRRRIAAAALVAALPLTMAAGCQEEGEVGPGVEQEEGEELDQEQGEEGEED